MKTLSKYQNFLADNDVYLANRTFWNDALAHLSQEPYEEWVTTQFANGDDFFDGNPITSALYRQTGKAIRIIQLAIDPNVSQVRAWLEHIEDQSTPITELVLAVQPYDEAYQRSVNVLTFFLNQSDLKEISKYVRAFNNVNQQADKWKKAVTAMQVVNPAGADDLVKSMIDTVYKRSSKKKSQLIR